MDNEIYHYLINRPVVEASLSVENLPDPQAPIHRIVEAFVFDLVIRGLTPLTLFYAIESISGLLEEAIFFGDLSEEAEVKLIYEAGALSAQPHPLTEVALLEEIEERCNCTQEVARGLLIWLIEVARCKPHLFRWFASSPLNNGVSLFYTGENNHNLAERWKADSRISKYYERLHFDVHDQKNVIPLIKQIEANDASFNDNDGIRSSHKLGQEMLLSGWGKK